MKGGVPGIHSSTNFVLLKNSNLLPHPGKEKPLPTTFDNQLIELDSVDSTNNYAMARIHAGLASDGMICLARHQWAGKGQRGKIWQSEPGQNLMMSLTIEPGTLILSQQFLFSYSVALGILDFLRSKQANNWTIKWPNDIYWNDRKAAGILIENIVQGKKWLWSVAGIGMNLNQERFPSDLPNPVSLKQITGNDYDSVSVVKELKPKVLSRISLLRTLPLQILTDFNESLYKINKSVSLKRGEELLITRLNGVNEKGHLLTEMGGFLPGEIEFIQDR
jgi:BirA family transcriptional regulator, biotin operon repressor / biotin---[acetyl-CoA-carboxylase] ligase